MQRCQAGLSKLGEGEDMTQADNQTELLTLRSELNELIARAKSRDTEWRRLGRIAQVTCILVSVVGAGLMIANVTIERSGSNSNLHDHLVMMGIAFILAGLPLMFIGQALSISRRS